MSRLRRLVAALVADRIAAVLFVAVFAAYGIAGQSIRASLETDVVGPGLFPGIIAVLGVGLALIMLVKPGPTADEHRVHFDAVALAPAGLLLAYVLSLEFVGFPLATAVFLAAAFKYLGCPGRIRPVIYSVVSTAALVGLFHYSLGLWLPRGELLRIF